MPLPRTQLTRPHRQVRLLPSVVEVFSSSAVTLLPNVISDGETERTIAENVDEDDVKVDRISVAYIGPNGREAVHLLVSTFVVAALFGPSLTRVRLQILLTNGQLALYEAHPSLTAVSTVNGGAMPRLACRFVKTAIRHLASGPARRKGPAASDLPPPRRDFRSFRAVGGHAGVFVLGEEAVWILKGEHGPVRCFEHGERGVYGFCELAGGMQQDELEGPMEGDEAAIQTRQVRVRPCWRVSPTRPLIQQPFPRASPSRGCPETWFWTRHYPIPSFRRTASIPTSPSTT